MFGIQNILAGPAKKFATDVLGFKAYRMPTGSMETTLLTGDLIIMDSKYFMKNGPQRRDLVIFQPLPLGNIKGKPLYVYWAKDKSRIGRKLK